MLGVLAVFGFVYTIVMSYYIIARFDRFRFRTKYGKRRAERLKARRRQEMAGHGKLRCTR